MTSYDIIIELRFKIYLSILGSIATNVNRISMVSHRRVVNNVIAILAVRRDSNVIRMANVHVMIMLKDGVVIDAKRINTIVIKAAWTVHIATI